MPTTSRHPGPRPLAERLAAYGCTEIIRLDEKLASPEQLDYLDLLPSGVSEPPKLAAVAAYQGAALLYLIDGEANSGPIPLAEISHRLANRSDPAWLGVVKPGSLEVFPVGFGESKALNPIRLIEESDNAAPFFFQSLVHGTFEENHRLKGTDYVYRRIFDLLMQTTNAFVPKKGEGKIDALDVLSMAGRALFFRFLIDRRIVLEKELLGADGICPDAAELKDAFSSAEKAARTSAWLDSTFNGDFLPLIDESIPADALKAREQAYLRFYNRMKKLVGSSIFSHLHAILRGWKAVGGGFQMEIDWGDLDFAHIPVGVLSQVYESFSRRADPRTARETSVHYTPRTIATLMVEEAFAAIKKPADAKILDGACGAGIFLVLAYRRLVRERWLRDDERPRTATIQNILYKQVRGFDVSESALRLAALALYITAIELNASPRPPASLKFPRNLRGEVLYRFRSDSDTSTLSPFPLGSLGPEASPGFTNSFDVVISNPPWTRLRDDKPGDTDVDEESEAKSATDALNDEFTNIGRRVLESRGLLELARRYVNPDKNPDLPFLWRATEWAKDGGIIAFAMPARLFGRTTGRGFDAWRAVLNSIKVTGLINGADLRWTAVWSGVKLPFCMLFARNAKPDPDHRFQFASPVNEPSLNRSGRFRIDYDSAKSISAESVERQPWLLKTLSLGTWLDAQIMDSLTDGSLKTLGEYWSDWDVKRKKTGKGFDRSPKLKQTAVDFLGGLKVLEPPTERFSIDYSSLMTYAELFGSDDRGFSTAHMPRRKELYQPPLVILPKAPGEAIHAPKAYRSSRALAFSQIYYGYSCADHPQEQTLASLIYLLAHSTLFRYFSLMTSVSLGADRMLFTKQDFDSIPFPDISRFSAATIDEIKDLASRLEHDDVKPWRKMDALIFKIYGLHDDAIRTAEDTLFSSAAYRAEGREALEFTTRQTRRAFIASLREALEPYFEVCGAVAAVRETEPVPDSGQEPWSFLAISCESTTVSLSAGLLRKAMVLANQGGCSRIIVSTPGNRGILLGLLNQRRWWTITRARLCSQHIIRNHLEACGLPEEV